MNIYRNKHSSQFKIIAIVVVCLFSFNVLSCAYNAKNKLVTNHHVLAAQSIFKPLRDAGIEDSIEVVFEILAGVRLLHAGKTPSAVNGILTETYRGTPDKRKIEFLADTERVGDYTIARFRVVSREDVSFEIRYQDTETKVLDETKRNAGDDVNVKDAKLDEILPIANLTYGNVFQANDSIAIRATCHKTMHMPPAASKPSVEGASQRLHRLVGKQRIVNPAQTVRTKVSVDLVGFGSPDQPNLATSHALYALAGNLKAYFNDDVRIFYHDMYADHSISIDSIADDVVENRPRVLCLSIVAGTLNLAKELFNKVKERIPEDQQPLIVLGNSVPSYLPGVLLKEYFPGALIVQGEGELPLIEIVEHAKGQMELDDVHNLLYMQGGRLVTTERSQVDLNELASPDMDEMVRRAKQGVGIFLEASRGCPWGNCSFCAGGNLPDARKEGRRWRPRDTERVLSELRVLIDNDIKFVNFADEEFIGPGIEGVRRVSDLARGIIKISQETGKTISFGISCRVDSLWDEDDDEGARAERWEMLRLLKEAGAHRIFLGIESGSPSQLRRYGKGFTVEEAENAIKLVKEAGINLEVGFIMFDPLVTLGELEENVAFVERNGILSNTSWFLNALRVQEGTLFSILFRRMPELEISKDPDPNTLNYHTKYKHKDVEKLEILSLLITKDTARLYFMIKVLMRVGKDGTYAKYRDILLRHYMRTFKDLLDNAKGGDANSALQHNNILFMSRLNEARIVGHMLQELNAEKDDQNVLIEELKAEAESILHASSLKVAQHIIAVPNEDIAEVVRPPVFEGDAGSTNEMAFIIKPEGTFNEELISDILRRLWFQGYAVEGIRVLSRDAMVKGNIFERQHWFAFQVAREGERLFSAQDRAQAVAIYDVPDFEQSFGIPFSEIEIIPAYDLTKKYGFTEKEIGDLWERCFESHPFMKGDVRGINKIASRKYVVVTRDPRVMDGKPFMLVNGVCAQMKLLAEKEGGKTVALLIRGTKQNSTAWKPMREVVLGDKPPLHSPPGSIRYDAYTGRMSVTQKLTPWLNIAHMSSGPFEGLWDEMLWFDINPNSTAFGSLLQKNGYSREEIEYFLTDPLIKIDGRQRPLFDWTEKMDAQDAIDFIVKALPPYYNDKAMPTMTFNEFLRYAELHDSELMSVATNEVASERIRPTSSSVSDYPATGTEMNAHYRAMGNELIRNGKVGQVFMAGGTAGRWFGYDVPERLRVRFLADAYEFSGRMRSFAELKIGYLQWASREAGGQVPLWVVTSELNDDAIREFLENHNYFGLPEDDVRYYVVGEVPRLNPTRADLKAAFPDETDEWIDARIEENGGEGDLFRLSDGAVSKKAEGHFDAIASLIVSRELQVMIDRGIEYLVFSDATNLGTNMDPVILGMFSASDKDVLHVLAKKNRIFYIKPTDGVETYKVIIRDDAVVYSSLPENIIPVIEAGQVVRIVNKTTSSEIDAKITGKLEKGGTLADVDGQPQIVEGFRFPRDYDQGAIPYFSTAHQLVKVSALLELFGMTVDEYRNASPRVLAQKMTAVGARLNTYLEPKEVLDESTGKTRIAVQLSRLSGDVTSLLSTEYVLIDRDGKSSQCAFIPFKQKADIGANCQAVSRALTGRLLFMEDQPSRSKGAPAERAISREEMALSPAHMAERNLLMTASRHLRGSPVNIYIGLAAIPRNGLTVEQETEQLEQNMETLAGLIAWHNIYGLDVRYILQHPTDSVYSGRASLILQDKLKRLGSVPGVDVNELLFRIGTPHTGDDVIEVSLKSLEAIKAIKSIPDKTYFIALKDERGTPGIAIPNYPAAANMGLALAALRIAKEKDSVDYNELRDKTLRVFEDIYKRCGTVAREGKFTVDELELMVMGSSDTRLYYAILYALPPIIKTAIEELRKYHEALHLLLQAA